MPSGRAAGRLLRFAAGAPLCGRGSALRPWPGVFPSGGLCVFSWIPASPSAKMSLARLAGKCDCTAAKRHTHWLQASLSPAPGSGPGGEKCENKMGKWALGWGASRRGRRRRLVNAAQPCAVGNPAGSATQEKSHEFSRASSLTGLNSVPRGVMPAQNLRK